MLGIDELRNNVTLPACVTDLSIIAYEDEQKNLGNGYAGKFDLGYGGKHTLKTTASTIYISPFVDIRNGTLELRVQQKQYRQIQRCISWKAVMMNSGLEKVMT